MSQSNNPVQLDQSKETVAEQIWQVFQQAYEQEAVLIGTENFPPLRRSKADIQKSGLKIMGIIQDDSLVAVAELDEEEQVLILESFVVAPSHFREGIGTTLLQYIMAEYSSKTIMIETTALNVPAINLYTKFGFIESPHYFTNDGFEMVRLFYNRKE